MTIQSPASASPEIQQAIIYVDLNKIRQAISNILEIAIKFSKVDTSVVIDTSLKVVENKEWFVIRIKDTGPGLAPVSQR